MPASKTRTLLRRPRSKVKGRKTARCRNPAKHDPCVSWNPHFREP